MATNEKDKVCVRCKNAMHNITQDAEFIQLDVHNNGETWCGPKRTKRSNPESIVERYLQEINSRTEDLFYGNLPPINKTREEFDAWEKNFLREKMNRNDGKNKEYSWICNDNDFIRKNYHDKGNNYIQIRDYGLYHLGEDICKFDVPEFKPDKVILRIRCKRRGGKGCAPSSITMSAWISGLMKSPYSLDNKEKLPPALRK